MDREIVRQTSWWGNAGGITAEYDASFHCGALTVAYYGGIDAPDDASNTPSI